MSTNTILIDASGLIARYGNPYVLTAALVIVFGLFVQWATSSKSDPREPPLLGPKFPIIGHLVGIMNRQADYFQDLCKRSPWPIFTLNIFSKKIYVITSPELVQSVFRNAKTVSFDPIAELAFTTVFQMGKDEMRILSSKVPGIDEDEKFPVNRATVKIAHATLQPGPALYETNAAALNRFSMFLDEMKDDGPAVDLYEWLTKKFTIATAEALYGPVNPISEDESLIQSLLDFESSIGLLFLNVMPSITCPKGHRSRGAFTTAFKRYYNGNHYQNASPLIKARYEALTAPGFTHNDLASFDIGMLMAATMNSNPGIFWLVSYIYSDQTLLASIRQEIDATTTSRSSKTGKTEVCINISLLHSKCPLLVACWNETLRLRAATVANRSVISDTLLNDTYLLKAGAVVQLPFNPMHTSPSTWGADSHVFNPEHFLPSATEKLGRDDKKRRKQGFTPFGGGNVLCPGRYLASSEILGVVATLVAGFEMEGVRLLGCKVQVMSAQVKQPDGVLNVKIRRREGFEDVKWVYEAGKGEGEGMVFD